MNNLRLMLAGILMTSPVLSQAETAPRFSLSNTPWSIAQQQNIDPNLLYAVALTESRRTINGRVQPWPWSVNADGNGKFFDTREQAEQYLQEALDAGVNNVDVGPLQISLRWHGHRVENPADFFDLATTVSVGSEILREAMDSSPNDAQLGIGRYHHWKDESLSRKYGGMVLQYLKVIESARRS